MAQEMVKLTSRWGEEVNPEAVLQEYPRPQLVRRSYYNLNGYWDYTILPEDTVVISFPERWDGRILVPFSPECSLSGVNRQLKPGERLFYRRYFTNPGKTDERIILHFGAVDQFCRVYVNGQETACHMGGYLSFSCDITKALQPGENELLVQVLDDSDTSYHARGKQKLEPGGMFYTAQSGIWQTVWMECVPDNYITDISCKALYDRSEIEILVSTEADTVAELSGFSGSLKIPAAAGETQQAETEQPYTERMLIKTNRPVRILLKERIPWTPETPYLYTARIRLAGQGETDEIDTYFAVRLLTVEKDEAGIPRLCLNHRPYFQRGVLDQGYWPDGLYTAPSDEALMFDILEMKKMGFNMIRKHAKIEPARWYYHCDRIGMLVWQDMVNGGSSYKHWFVTYLATAATRMKIHVNDYNRTLFSRTDTKGRKEFICEMKETVRQLNAFPSIVLWTVFNEGWGQFDAVCMEKKLRQMDPARWIDAASGWFDQGCGDVCSIHNYFFSLKLPKEQKRAVVLSEFGGYSMRFPEHSSCRKLYGYRKFTEKEALNEAYRKLVCEVERLKEDGLCASVYTQLSDIEEEVNGIFTYDRKVRKIDVTLPGG